MRVRVKMNYCTSKDGTNLAAMITFSGIAGIAWCVKNKCKHSTCQFHNAWFQCAADDKNTLRSNPQPGAAIAKPKRVIEV